MAFRQQVTQFRLSEEFSGRTILDWLRSHLPKSSWSQCRNVLRGRRVRINGVVAVHEGRRLAAGDVIELREHGDAPPKPAQLSVVFADRDLVVVDKPPHIETTRRPEELHWTAAKKQLAPTLDELAAQAVVATAPQRRSSRGRPHRTDSAPSLWRVHRLDRETSGLVVFARTSEAARGLIRQFAEHAVERLYQAVIPGYLEPQTIEARLVRDRGDGLRGSTPDGRSGQRAVTHLRPIERIGRYTIVECRLETGRTHQIRIHLAESGHPVCGDERYHRRPDGTTLPDESGAPRLALHARRLSFRHPQTDDLLSFESALPADLERWLQRLRDGEQGLASAAEVPRDRG